MGETSLLVVATMKANAPPILDGNKILERK